MREDINQLQKRIEELERENRYLKRLLDESGISYGRGKSDYSEITYDKAREFFSYFWGRTDVYAKRYVNKKTGVSGYFPQCNNFWKYGICPKAERVKIQCKDCENKAWSKLGASQIIAHLKGESEEGTDVIGCYPIFKDNTCRFLAFDFDNHDAENDDLGFDENDITWKEEVNALGAICEQCQIPFLVEKSRSGRGAHLWIFFEKPIQAALARKFGNELIAKGAEYVSLTSFRYYDRMLPSQDELKAGGLGNLIALPLQGKALEKGNSAFVDKNWEVYPNQWQVLKNTEKISEERIREFLDDNTFDAEEEDKPWERRKAFDKDDVSGVMDVTLSNCIYVRKTNLAPRIQNQIRRLAAVSNPSYYKNNAMGISNFNNTRYVYLGFDDGEYICIPRGLFDELRKRINEAGIKASFRDERCSGRYINAEFIGQLREEQIRAVESVTNFDTGIISAATAFGKTVVCSNIIATKKVNTLILLESTPLIEQWQNALEQFLDINEELPEYATPTGRIKKRKSLIGVIHGAKDTSTGIIDIAMVGSLKKKGEFHSRLKTYGLILVDECHHSAQDTMSEILMEANAKCVYGVTATPFRGDGLGKINNMLLGEIRFQYTAKERAKAQGIDHIVIPRFTRVVNPHGRDRVNVNDAYELIRNSQIRNEQIINDIKVCIEEDRTPVVLSKYKEHAQIIYNAVHNFADKVFLLTGDLSKKERKYMREEMNCVNATESMILVATGQLIGEGFDYPRLDTLIMATPVAWKGIVEQYAGRLNRDYPGKKSVIVYDYIDSNLRIFDNMYAKRLKAYKRIGYSLKTEILSEIRQENSIFDYESYREIFLKDLLAAKDSVIISSPSLRSSKIQEIVNLVKPLQEKGVKVTVVTWNPDSYPYGDSAHKVELIKVLEAEGIYIELQKEWCQHYAVIDQRIVWYGSVNLLGKEDIEDNIMRVESFQIAGELLEMSFNRKLPEIELL